MDYVQLLVNRCGTKLKEETSQGAASRSTVKPEDDWIIHGIVSGLKEP